jgi:hypothetical protein
MAEDSIESLREQLKDEDISFKMKQEIRKKVVGMIKKEKQVKFEVGHPVEYKIIYDTFSGNLEPVYFWTLDFLRNKSPSGLGMDVDKTGEEFEATAGGGFFGELGSRATIMQERGMKIMETVNAVLRTIINLIYDLKEFEMRLNAYDDANSDKKETKLAGEYALKGIWMDQVDVKTGLGSINQLARGDLQFVTLRDAFMQARIYKKSDGKFNKEKTFRDIGSSEKKNDGMDLNKRVKALLKKKVEEYLNWRTGSEKELRNRFMIEKNYLKAQVNSLKLYTTWAKPYLRAAQKLGMTEFKTDRGLPSPDMVTTFNSMQMDLKLLAKSEFDPGEVHPSYGKIEFSQKYNTCLEVEFFYRTAPQVVRGQGQSQHYTHMGTVDVKFRAYVLNQEDLDDIYAMEVYEDMALVEELTDMSLGQLQEDLEHYIYPKEEKKKVEKEDDIFTQIFKRINGISKSFDKFGKKFKLPGGVKKAGKYEEGKVKKEAQKAALASCNTLYTVFKKSHRMVTW